MYEFDDDAVHSIGRLRTQSCGQSFAVHEASPMAEVQDIVDIRPVRAPEFHGTADICINQYESYMDEGRTERGVVFDDCISVWIDRLAVGGHADTPPVEFRDSRHIFVNTLHLGGSPTWGGIIENVKYSTFRIFCNVNERGLKYTGPETDANRIVFNGQNLDEAGLVVTDEVTGCHYVTGNVVDTDALAVDIRSMDAEIHLDHFNARGNESGDLCVPDGNYVHATDSSFERIDGTPRTQNRVGSPPRTPNDPTKGAGASVTASSSPTRETGRGTGCTSACRADGSA